MTDPLTPAQIAASLPAAELQPGGDPDVTLTDVTHDSREVGPGVLFAARPGATADGHDFAPAAVAAGASALLVQRPLPALAVPQILVPSVAEALGPAADLVHHHPTADIAVLGVTGTNGKTTTAYLLDAIWRTAGHTTGLVGTIETRIGDASVPGVRTTPEASDLHRLFARMRAEGVTAASIEVSSHGLALGRLGGVRFAAALFTNLTQDHLDFHPDMESYYQAKARLFTPELAGLGVVTVDDAWGARLAAQAPITVWTLSRKGPADVTAGDVVSSPDGSTFTAVVRGARIAVRTGLPGDYNITNALGAIATAFAAGVPLEVAAAGVAALAGVPGRMERVDVGQPFGVLVDYAHTPDSVANVLSAARRLTRGRVIVVLGCGGDRDRAKRPVMARAAVAGADAAIFTSDNPRSEDPDAILDDMVAGLADPASTHRIPDRAEAISHAVTQARPGDVVVIAGKGHEPYQELASGRIDFDDRVIARTALMALQGGGPPADRGGTPR
ncbi:MAG TPA: UDP-N-acetylmuramoyl-L-alanyl-D-glutamate--2,6-diaminopimelate ligase [Euzebya sp.]|nr:UDP-N-acetylmuramoyl-L-alanyl-D-glutamate--2,6-diaminopimelate ligase [Euzebya sp.]